MLHAQLLERVRETVRGMFAAQGITSFEGFSESILIRGGYYCGRSFACGGMRAVWFVEENLLKFFGRDNSLLSCQAAVEENQPEEIAAA